MSDDPRDREPAPLDWIDPVVHAPARLSIMTQLYVVEAMDATFLVNRTGLTWGNLSTHLRKLEESGYVDLEKEFRGRKPCTMIRLTDKGREAFRRYRASMQQALGDLPD
ncbi:MAG: helix-turn-helix domain-containing protein [Gemmatimonadales bacterium]|nr:helix-turn-helix domain-containing protein [Gemmatimonadales bacterium]